MFAVDPDTPLSLRTIVPEPSSLPSSGLFATISSQLSSNDTL